MHPTTATPSPVRAVGSPDPITPETWIRDLLRPVPPGAARMICRLTGDPGRDDEGIWSGERCPDLRDGLPPGAMNANLYVCASAIRPDQYGILHRRVNAVAAPLILILDDIGTGPGAKTPPERIPVRPTSIVETSPGNHQWVYRLAPGTSVESANRLHTALRASGFADSKAFDPVRWIRVPGALNLKARVIEQHGEPWRVRCVWHQPNRTFTVEALAAGLGLTLHDPAPPQPVAPPDDIPVEIVLDALRYLDPACNRDPWLRVGMALHYQTGGSPDGLDLWDRWSRGELTGQAPPENYDPSHCAQQWRSFGRRSRERLVTTGTLWRKAREAGWPGDPRIDPALEALLGIEDPDPLPEPSWIALERARRQQAHQSLGQRGGTLRTLYASIQAALADPTVTLIEAPMGTGKTYQLQEIAIEYLKRDNNETLLIIATSSHALISETYAGIVERLGESVTTKLKAVSQDEPLDAFIHPKTGDRPHRVILCSHATLLPRGHDLTTGGRVLRKLQGAKDRVSRSGARPLHVWAIVDEAHGFASRLSINLSLGLREVDTTDPVLGDGRRRPVGRCPQTCGTCHSVLDYQTHARGASLSGTPALKLAPSWPTLPGAQPVDLQWLRRATMAPVMYHGVAVAEFARDQLPTEQELPLFDLATTASGGVKAVPRGDGVIRELAAQPGATVRTGLPRDKTDGLPLDPSEVTDDREIIYPHYSCAPVLVSWNARPLAELRAAADRLTLLSATLGTGTVAMVEQTIGAVKIATVPAPDERKMKAVLILGVTRWALERPTLADLAKIKPVLLLHARKSDAARHADTLANWRRSDLLTATWGRRGAESDVMGRANLLAAYMRAAIAHGANLPYYRTVIGWTGCYASARHVFALGHSDVFAAIEDERRSTCLQGFGRPMRWDSEDDTDSGFRVVIAVVDEDPRTRQPVDDLVWLANGLQASAERVELRWLHAFPKRAVQAVAEWHATGQTTVDDRPAGNASTLTKRQRVATAEARDREKQAKREAKRAELREKARAMIADGTPWRDVRNGLSLGKYFSADEIEAIRSGTV